MKKKFVPLFVKLDPPINKALVEAVANGGKNKKAVVQSALNVYFAMLAAAPKA